MPMWYKNIIYNTGLAGLESEVLTRADENKMDLAQMKLLRRMDGDRHTYILADDGRHICSNATLRKENGIASITSELRVRRLKMRHDVTKYPEETKQLRPALLGTLKMEYVNACYCTDPPWCTQFLQAVKSLYEDAGREWEFEQHKEQMGIHMLLYG